MSKLDDIVQAIKDGGDYRWDEAVNDEAWVPNVVDGDKLKADFKALMLELIGGDDEITRHFMDSLPHMAQELHGKNQLRYELRQKVQEL